MKYYIAIFALIAGLVGTIIYQQYKINNQKSIIDNNVVVQKQLKDEITRSESKQVSSDQLIKELQQANIKYQDIIDDLKSFNAVINSITTTTTTSQKQQSTNLPSDIVEPAPSNTHPSQGVADPNGYYITLQYKRLTEKFSNVEIPIGLVGFDASSKTPWSVLIPQRKYVGATIIGLDENKRAYGYSTFTINVDGKDYKIQIDKSTTLQQTPEAKWSWWNPIFSLGLDSGISTTPNVDFATSINFNFLNYGMYKKSPDWMFLQVGVSYTFIEKNVNIVK